MTEINLMAVLLLIVCLMFIAMSGRNDGAPIVALAVQSRGRSGWVSLAYFALFLPGVPLAGFWGVAASLDELLGPETGQPAIALALISSVLITIGLSNAMQIPTSITLAIVGAIVGAAVTQGRAFPGPLLAKVLGLGMVAPFVAGALAFVLSRAILLEGRVSRRLLLMLRGAVSPLLVLAYAANDGQKIIFVAALAMAAPLTQAASSASVLIVTTAVFLVGTVVGLHQSGRFIRHGVASIRPLDLLWAEAATSAAVLVGAGMGVPLSMTQSLTGAVAGAGISHSVRSVYWRNVGRIGIAWIWTLPTAAAVAYLFVRLAA